MNSYSVADAIRYFSGIQIKDFGGVGGLKTVDIRSMGTHHLGVFYDGIPLGNAQNGQIDLGKFSLDNIEEISLYHGQKSEILQPAKDFGSAGNIYLKTRRPKFEGDKKFNIKAIFRTGSFGLANPSFLWEQRISRRNAIHRVSTTINAEYIYSTGKYKFRYKKVLPDGTVAWDTTAVRRNGDIQAVRVEGSVYGSAPKLNWNTKLYFYNSERGIPGAIVNNVWKHSQRQWDRNFFTQSSLSAKVNRWYELLAHLKYANDYLRYLNPDFALMQYQTCTQQELYSSFVNKFSIIRKWEMALSTDFQWNQLDANLRNFVSPQRFTTLAALATAFEIWRFKSQASVLTTIILEKANGINCKDISCNPSTKPKFTPAFFLSYKPLKNENLMIGAFYKHIFRMPTINDLYYNDIVNILLRPEYSTQFNFGVHYTKTFKKGILETVILKTDAYYIKVTDKIVAIPKGSGQFSWMMMNIGLVKIRGIDAAAQFGWKFPYQIRLQTNINYTFQKAQDFSDPTDNDPRAGTWGSQIAYVPWHNGAVTLKFSYKTYELNYCFIYVGERYHNSSNIRENYEQPWYTHDLSVGKEFRFRRRTERRAPATRNAPTLKISA
jgi:outer membrane receptor protein involved in Fe transport